MYKCDELKARLPESERNRVRVCSDQASERGRDWNSTKVSFSLKSCGQGIVDFGKDTWHGLQSLALMLANIPRSIISSNPIGYLREVSQDSAKCASDREHKLSLLAPILFSFTSRDGNDVEMDRLEPWLSSSRSCGEVQHYVRQQIDMYERQLAALTMEANAQANSPDEVAANIRRLLGRPGKERLKQFYESKAQNEVVLDSLTQGIKCMTSEALSRNFCNTAALVASFAVPPGAVAKIVSRFRGFIDLSVLRYSGAATRYTKAPKMVFEVPQGSRFSDLPQSVQAALRNNMDKISVEGISQQVTAMSGRSANRYIVLERGANGQWGAYIPSENAAAQFGSLRPLPSEAATLTRSSFPGVTVLEGQQAGSAVMVDARAFGWEPGQRVKAAFGDVQTIGPNGAFVVINEQGVPQYIVQATGARIPVGYTPKERVLDVGSGSN